MEEYYGVGYDSQNTYLISLSRFDQIELLVTIIYSPQPIKFQSFMMSVWTWILLERNCYWNCIL